MDSSIFPHKKREGGLDLFDDLPTKVGPTQENKKCGGVASFQNQNFPHVLVEY